MTTYQTQQQLLQIPDLPLEVGATLRDVEIAYETYGRLNTGRSNAVLICHALTGDAHAAGPEEHPGWWQGLIGPGFALDTDRYFIICSNVLGGCNGSTGPQSLARETGKAYGSQFPLITIRDMVRAQQELIRHLGIEQLHLVIGGSMGGLQAIEWAVTYPEQVKHCIPIATSSQLSALAIGYNDVMRTAVINDPNWQNGDYYESHAPVQGFALARKIGMITYRSFDLFESRFGHGTTEENVPLEETRFQIESYLDYHGQKLVGRFDAGSYLCLLKAMDLHDIGYARGGIDEAIQRIQAKLLWVGIDSDTLYPAQEQRAWADEIARLGKEIIYREIKSVHGHDAFLIEYEQLNAIVGEFLQKVEGEAR